MENIETGWDMKKFRLECLMTQGEFAKMIGYGINRVSLVERKNMPLHFNMKLAIKKQYKRLKGAKHDITKRNGRTG